MHIPTEIVYEESPVGDSSASGSIERANQTIQGQIRAIKDYTERRIGATIGLDSSVLTWLVRHAAWTLTTFHLGGDGMTANQRIRGKQVNQQIAAFGEQIFFNPRKTAGPQQKLAVNWLDGCCLGFNTRKHIVSDSAAVVSCRSIRWRNKEERWNRDMLLGIVGNPWSLQDGHLEVTLQRWPDTFRLRIQKWRPDSDENQRRRQRQTHLHHEEDGVGATVGCKGFLGAGPGSQRVWRMILPTRKGQVDQETRIPQSGAGGCRTK